MSSKKKHNHNYNQKQNESIKVYTTVTVSDETVAVEIPVVDEYKPSENADKYPDIKEPEYAYKIIACRNDYTRLQEDITKYLNEGWNLAGGVSIAMTSTPFESTTVFSQAIYKK
jgi:hypothetical protein